MRIVLTGDFTLVYLDRVPFVKVTVECSRAYMKRMFWGFGELGFYARASVRAVGHI